MKNIIPYSDKPAQKEARILTNYDYIKFIGILYNNPNEIWKLINIWKYIHFDCNPDFFDRLLENIEKEHIFLENGEFFTVTIENSDIFRKIKSIILDFKNETQTMTPSQTLKSFSWKGTPEQLKKLYEALKGTYIDAETDFKDFEKVFSGEPIESHKKIIWTLKAGKNKMPDKKALITLFELLKSDFIEKLNFKDYSKILLSLFKNPEGDFTPFTHSNRPNKENGFGDNWNNIKSIVDSL